MKNTFLSGLLLCLLCLSKKARQREQAAVGLHLRFAEFFAASLDFNRPFRCHKYRSHWFVLDRSESILTVIPPSVSGLFDNLT